ncbi:MAG TPA: tetratricopeptide repeat protein [Pyrinomonadaceae bacterium]|nr:tetratricopeptide repeat protein [Pyrinomonadaceae bacterium]
MSLPKALQDSLRAGNVIPFVGAGVSMSVLNAETGERLFPGWRELLEQAAGRLEEEDRISYANDVRALLGLSKPNYLEAARLAREGLGEAIWHSFLEGQLDYPRERAKPDSLRLAEAIWKLNSQLIITTNYDDVLRWASASQPVLWDREAPAEMAAFLQNKAKRPTIWHLHGHIHNKSKIILTRDSYSRLYPEANEGESKEYYKAALQTLHTLLASHTFLFIGFSLDDVYFGMQLEGIKNIYQGATGPHYVLMRRKELERGAPFEDTVRAIAFEDFGEPLLQLVNELGAIADRKEPGASHAPIETVAPPPPRVADYNPRNYVFSVPFREKGEQVIGREKSLQAVREQLTKGRRTAIGQTAAFQGLGGLGKTQLAVEYAYRFRETYPNGVIWLNADQDIDAQLTELAEKARWIASESEHKYKLEIARHRLRTYSDCLIIFDNLEDPQAIEGYLPEPQADPHILVTSRRDQPDFNPVPLDPLDEVLSFDLLLQEAGRWPIGDEEESAAHEIAGALDGLPLALELAGAYLRHRHVSWQQYRDLLRHSLRTAFLPGKLNTFTKHETDLYSTLKINENIFEDEPKLKEILDLLTWSGTAPMGVSLMCTLLDVKTPLELTNAFGLGTALRLLQKTPDVDSYSIHRLVGEVRREEIPLQARQGWVDNICRRTGDWFEERRKKFSELFRFEAEIDHLQAWQENARQYAPKHSSRLTWLQAYPSYHRGQYLEIKRLVKKALELLEQEHETDLKLKAHLLNDLGFCYGSLGDYKRHLEYAEKALEIRRELLGELHHDTATSFNNVGSVYGQLGDYKRSLEYAEKALEIRREVLSERHPDTAASFHNVGIAYGQLGEHKRSLEYAEKALEIRREVLSERHPDIATSLNSIGTAYWNLGDNKRNLEYSEKSLEIYRELFGERHPDTATSFNNIGTAYGQLGDYKRSLEYTKKALEIRREVLSERHPDTAASFNNIGMAYGRLGDYKRNIEYVEKALEIYRELLGDKHPHTIFFVGNLVSLLTKINHRPKAFKLLEEFLSQLPKDHIHYNWLKKLEQNLLTKTIQPGFRQPSGKSRGRKHKGKKNKRR